MAKQNQPEHGVAARVLTRRLDQALAGIDEEYRRERQQAAEALHNDLVEIIHQHQPSNETLLWVLQVIERELVGRFVAEVVSRDEIPLSNESPQPIIDGSPPKGVARRRAG